LALIWASLPALVGGPAHLPMQAWPVPDAFPLELAKLIGMFACLLTGAALGSRPGVTRHLFDVFVVMAIAYLTLTLVMRQIDPFTVFGHDKGLQRIRFTGTLFSANAAACIFAVIAIMAFGRAQLAWRNAIAGAWQTGPSVLLAVSGLTVLMALGACALTRSRVSLVLALIAATIMLLRQHRRTLLPRAGQRTARWVLLATILAALAVVILLALPTIGRFETLSGDVSDRLFGMQHFLAMADRSPWFGYGLGSFPALNVATLQDRDVDILWNLGAAHNAPIQAALEAGWPFLLLITAGIVIAVMKTVQARRMETPDPLMMAQLLAVALIFACSLADIALNVPAVCALAAFLSGTALGRIERASGLVQAARPHRMPTGA
jgi:O-antigen ligase